MLLYFQYKKIINVFCKYKKSLTLMSYFVFLCVSEKKKSTISQHHDIMLPVKCDTGNGRYFWSPLTPTPGGWPYPPLPVPLIAPPHFPSPLVDRAHGVLDHWFPGRGHKTLSKELSWPVLLSGVVTLCNSETYCNLLRNMTSLHYLYKSKQIL